MRTYDNIEENIKVPRFEEGHGFYTTKSRSYNMSRIRGKNSRPELLLRRALWAKNIRFRIHTPALPGRPDISIKKYKLAIFIDGEFWHGYNWHVTKNKIKSNRNFWIPKIERNMQRDMQVNNQLKEMNYTVFRFWSHEIVKHLPKVINQIELFLETRKLYP